ncbi:zinc-binding dehydrogenase [Nocardia carnea]|uniref:zinc-binding dehydrogenase n=1 Tax=Nocardia carnea TaxID=37328 RepID=UPI002456ED1E|nr:zinc-binding dehydrogenase [Nocardia carnea]
MKAWQLTRYGSTLEQVDVPDPVPAAGQVVVEVKAAGLCTSDVHIMDGTMKTSAEPPVVIGHEIAGIITEVGPEVPGFAVGDRVGIDPTANGVFGPKARVGGGYGMKTAAWANELVRIPDPVEYTQAAAATDAGSTAHKAVAHSGQVGPGTRVGIIGLGALGLTGARIAVLRGAQVYAADVNDSVFGAAKAAGVLETFDSAAQFEGLDLDVVIDFAGVDTTSLAIDTVKPGGRVVQVGLGSPTISFPATALVFREVHLVGSLAGSVADTAALYDLMADGAFEMPVETIRWEEINDGLDRIRRGEVRGKRLVASYEI